MDTGEGLACSAQPVSLLPERPQISPPCSLLVQGLTGSHLARHMNHVFPVRSKY